MPIEKINGINIYYEIHGEGFPLVMTYGLGGSCKFWEPNIKALASKYKLILWDHRGHGQSDSPRDKEDYGLQTFAQDLKGLMDHLEIEKAHVGGQSLGAGSAVRFCINHPERVTSLLLIASASASGLPIPAKVLEMRNKTIDLALNEGMAAVAEAALTSNPNMMSYAKQGPEQVEIVKQMYLDCDPVGYAYSVWSLITGDSITDQLSSIVVPTLVMAGDGDPVMPAVEATHSNIPHSKLVIIPGASHFANLDTPEAFNQNILDFLSDVST